MLHLLKHFRHFKRPNTRWRFYFYFAKKKKKFPGHLIAELFSLLNSWWSFFELILYEYSRKQHKTTVVVSFLLYIGQSFGIVDIFTLQSSRKRSGAESAYWPSSPLIYWKYSNVLRPDFQTEKRAICHIIYQKCRCRLWSWKLLSTSFSTESCRSCWYSAHEGQVHSVQLWYLSKQISSWLQWW